MRNVQLIRSGIQVDVQPNVLADFDSSDFDCYLSIIASRSFFLLNVANPEHVLRILTHLVLLFPSKPRYHAQRLILLCRQAESSAISAALLDLFLGLEPEAVPIKRYFLRYCQSYIDSDLHDFLESNVATTLNLQEPILKQMSASLLWRQADQSQNRNALVSRVEAPSLSTRSDGQLTHETNQLLTEVDELITNGQIDLAMDALEDALLSDPEQDEVSHLLLKLYALADAQVRQEIMAEQLKLNNGSLPKHWPVSDGGVPS